MKTIETSRIRKEIEIAAPIDVAFEAVLDELGPEGADAGRQGRFDED